MSWGSFNAKQGKAIQHHVEGRVVYDLGAGNLVLARELLRLGAKHVHAVDKEDQSRASIQGITFKKALFIEVLPEWIGQAETIFLSWPANTYDPALISLVSGCKTLIYLGKNTDGTACGCPSLFEAMLRRKLLAHVPDRANTLIVLGEHLEKPRAPTGEEYAGLSMFEDRDIVLYEQALYGG